MSIIISVVVIILAAWAVYHTVAESQQDKRIDRLEEKIKSIKSNS